MSSAVPSSLNRRDPQWLWMLALLGIGCWLLAICWHEWLCDPQLAAAFDGEGVRRWVLRQLGGRLTGSPLIAKADVPFENVLIMQIAWTLLWWLGGAAILASRLRITFRRSLLIWGYHSGWWWLLAGSWTVWRLLATVTGWTSAAIVLQLLPEMWLSLAVAGWGTTFISRFMGWKTPPQVSPEPQGQTHLECDSSSKLLSPRPGTPGRGAGGEGLAQIHPQNPSPLSPLPGVPGRGGPEKTLLCDSAAVLPPQTNAEKARQWRIHPAVWLSILAYTLIFGMMNTLLYHNLLIPHGDSAMYEEHLWNLLHGKGFRSLIDKGLFLGEHIQVIHLGLIPLYLLWPSHLLLEWCESLGLALGAIPVFRMAIRQTGSSRQAACLAVAYLLSLPLQRLDISIDFKTFRPEAFGIPLLLAAFDALDLRRWKTFGAWLFAALLVKEDYALIIGPLGIWLAIHECRRAPPGTSRWRGVWPGIVMALAAAVYLWCAVKIVIPYFKAGNEVHYARYFSQFGQTTNEIIYNLVRHPDWLLRELVTPENFLFGAVLCFSLAWLPLWSPGRLAVGAPLFAALCLNQIARNTQHHFHAPLVAVVFWAAAHGLATFGRFAAWGTNRWLRGNLVASDGTRFAVIMILLTSTGIHFWHSFTPVGLPFWDSYSGANWRRKYVPTARAAEFAKVLRRISTERHVASTDFVHPRFNHHARSYDYSSYRPNIPADVEYLVIDVRGPYSQIRSPLDVPEYQQHPERWELLPDDTGGYFYIFQRRRERTTP